VKRGRKPHTTEELRAAGTLRRDRHGDRAAPSSAPIEVAAVPPPPKFLTAGGRRVWREHIAHAVASGQLSERDTAAFGQWANLMGACIKAWKAGDVPPIAWILETRRLAEHFGMCGARSRAGAPATPPTNRFKAQWEETQRRRAATVVPLHPERQA
jgi:hypothetical protein